MSKQEIKSILNDHCQEYHEENGQIVVHDNYLDCNTTPPTPGTDFVNVTNYSKSQLYKFLGY